MAGAPDIVGDWDTSRRSTGRHVKQVTFGGHAPQVITDGNTHTVVLRGRCGRIVSVVLNPDIVLRLLPGMVRLVLVLEIVQGKAATNPPTDGVLRHPVALSKGDYPMSHLKQHWR